MTKKELESLVVKALTKELGNDVDVDIYENNIASNDNGVVVNFPNGDSFAMPIVRF